ncbi:pentapeptide repeat-containing protein [Methanosarcina mazei]|uniref:pentapeptide repeat-containing protein n=1 Tax=Methanosarcina mazei TaxID=2209 RepID=UPI0012D470DF|nr:pentapeptide repeat-containing protein [Methanosarcina mazei]
MGVLESIRYKINKNIYFFNQYIEKKKILMHPFKEKIKIFLEKIYYNTKPYQKNLITLVILAVVVLFFLIPICDFCYNYIFFYPLDKVSQFNTTNVTEKATIENLYRTTSIQFVTIIAQILGSLAILIGLVFAWGNLNIAKEGQITERFTRAVDQLGNPAQEIRLGGIHALGRISKESKKDYSTIMVLLADYVRINSNVYNHLENNYPKYGSLSMDILANEITTSGILDEVVSTDIQIALKIIGERKSFFDNKKDKSLNLKETFLRGAELSDLHLEGTILSWANLERAILIRTHLDNAYLKGTNLKFAYLHSAELKGANLEKVDLSGADLTLAHLEGANLKKVILKDAVLDAAHLEKADLQGASLEKAFLVITHLEGANLRFANLKEANLRLARLEGAELWKANFEGAFLYGASFEKASFGQINFKGANLSSAIFKEIGFGYANFEDATLKQAELEKANLIECKLNRADLRGANLEGAYLMEAELIGAKLLGTNLEGANLEGANLEGADLRAVNLKEAQLDGANLFGVNLENARLDNADLSRVDLRKARNLSIEQLSKVKSLDGAKIDEWLRRSLEERDPEKYQALLKKSDNYN